MGIIYYLCNGMTSRDGNFSTPGGLFYLNLSDREAVVDCTMFKGNGAPVTVTERVPARGRHVRWGDFYPQEPWGVKIESSEPLSVQSCFEYANKKRDTLDYLQLPEKERAYQLITQLPAVNLGTLFFVPDITSVVASPNIEELQFFTILNTGGREATVTFTALNDDRNLEERHEVKVAPEAVKNLEISDIGMTRKIGYAMKITSDSPVAIEQYRTFEGAVAGTYPRLLLAVGGPFMLIPENGV